MKSTLPLLAAAGAFLAPCWGSPLRAQGEPTGFQPLVIHQTRDPAFPLEPLTEGYLKGRVEVLIAVDASGKLTDSLAISYTEPYFALSALDALRAWSFEPARVDGRPIASMRKVDFDFRMSGPVVISQNISQFADRFIRDMAPERADHRAFNIREIDGKLTAIRIVSPAYPVQLAAKGIGGIVTLSYYVDEKGRVRMPSVVNDPRQELAEEAVGAVKQWQFEPPTRFGEPVLVWVRQDIRFDAGRTL
jgi:TonB family protein